MNEGVVVGPWSAVSDERLELGEGARNHGDGFIAVDLLAGHLLGVTRSGTRILRALDEPLGAVAPTSDGGWIAAAGTGIVLLPPSGEAIWLGRPEAAGATSMRMNDGVADPHGRFWAGSMAYDGTPGAGSLYRVDTDRSVTRVLTDLTVPNGPAFDETGAVMYLADSARGVIYRHDIDVLTGVPGPGAVFAQVDGASPDGMTVDVSGHLWSAMWGASRVHRYAPDGTLVEQVDVPARQPTCVALTPSAPHTLLVTSATFGLDPEADDGRLLMAPVCVGGLPTCAFGG